MSIVDNIVRGAVEGVVGESVGKRAPFLDRPDAQLERPTPGSPMPAPSFPLPARRDDSTTGTAPAADMSEGEGGPTGRGYSFSQSLAPGGLNFSTIQPQSSMQVSDIVKESKTMGGEFAGSIAGFKPYYNPATGRISTGAPNLGTFGLGFSFLASGVGSFIRGKQQEAAINAARGFSNNGVVSLNGQTVAVVDGKIYGNLPSDYAGGYHNLKKEILGYVNSLDASQKSGAYYEISQGGLGKTPTPGLGEIRPTVSKPDLPMPLAAQVDSGGDDERPSGTSYSISTGPGPGTSQKPGGYSMRAKGGPVQKTGFVEGSPDNYAKGDTVADTVKTKVRENSFVLNAPTVERLQEAGMLPKGVDNSDKKTTIKANKGGLIDVALSKGEYVIEPEEAQRIGYSFLEKINDQGKPEVDRRQAAADGGFINGYQNGGQTLPTVLPQPSPIRKKKIEGIAFADQELRNDLDKYLRGNPLGQLGYELVRMGQYEIRAGFAPKGRTSTLGGFTGSPKDSREKFESDTYRNRRTDTPVDQDAGVVFYYAGPNTKIKKIDGEFFRDIEEPRTDTDMRILTHELGHVGMRFLEEVQKEASGNPGYRFNPITEEYMMRVGDEIIRERNNLAYTKFSVTDPVEYEAAMYNRGRPPLYFLEKDSPEYNMYKNEWVENSKQAQIFLEKQFGFIPEVKKPTEKTYIDKFKELFKFGK